MNRRRLFLVLLAYYALHVAVRTFVSDGLDLDESEQVVLAQDFRLGYGAQPPLYTWIQAVAFQVFGVKAFALAFVKNALFCCLLVLVFLAARAFTPDDRLALVATMALAFMPEFAWQAHSRRSHSVLATAAGAATLLAGARLFARRPVAAYVGLGVAAGVGILSKYNYALFALPLLVAGLTLRRWRQVLLDRRLALSIMAFLVVAGPHLFWVATHSESVSARTAKYFVPGRLRGLWTLASAVGGLVLPLAFMFVVVTRRWRTEGPRTETERLLARTMLGSIVAALLVVVAGGVHLRERWLLPSLFVAPLFLTVRLRAHLDRRRRRALVVLAGIVFLGVLQAVPLRVWLGRSELGAPYRALAARIRAETGTPACILADSNLVGGHLRLEYPDTRVVVASRVDGPCLVVWDATQWRGPPPWLAPRVGRRPVAFVEIDGYRFGYAR